MSSDTHRLPTWLGPVLVLGIGAGLYMSGIEAPFTGDDILVTIENPRLDKPAAIGEFFQEDFDRQVPDSIPTPAGESSPSSRFGLYRPLLATSFTLNHLLGGLHPLAWRLTNLVLYLLCCLVVLALARRILTSANAALACALLFVVHPVHTESVASLLGGRAELLAGLCVLCGWWAFMAAGEKTGWRRILLDSAVAGLLAIGLLAKENAAVLPGVVMLWAFLIDRQHLARLALRVAPQLAVLAIYMLVRLSIVGRLAPVDWSVTFGDQASWQIALTALWFQVNYLRLALLPHPLQVQTCYHDEVASASHPLAAVAGLLLLVIVTWAIISSLRARSRGETRFGSFALLLFFWFLFPVSHVIPFPVVMAERFLFLPSFAVCLMGGWLLTKWSPTRPRASWSIVGLIALLGAGLTLWRNGDWADPVRLWTRSADCAPDSGRPFNNLGTHLLRTGLPQKALEAFERSISRQANKPRYHFNRGVALHRLKRINEAELAYRRTLALQPAYGPALLNLGALRHQEGDLADAATLFERAAKADPSVAAPFVNLGAVRQQQGRVGEAEKLYKLALEIAPGSIDARFNLARLLAGTARKAEAERLYRTVLRDKPDHSLALNNLANMDKDRGESTAAKTGYLAAIAADPACVPAHYNLGNLLSRAGELTAAERHYRLALQRAPKHLQASIALGLLMVRQGRQAEALTILNAARQTAPGDPRILLLERALGSFGNEDAPRPQN